MRVGLCGYGSMGSGHAELIQKHAGVSLVGIADRRAERRELAQEKFGVKTWESGEEMIDAGGLDVVFVCVPTYLHAALAIRAMKAGCHVFCEKPMSLNPELCAQMIETSKQTGKTLMIGQVLRFWPEYVYLKNTIDSGVYGKLIALSMTRVGNVSCGWENWYLDETRGGMQIFDRHIHDCDAILWMLGTPKTVYAYGASRDTRTKGGIFHSFTEYYYDGGLVVSAEGSADTVSGFPFTASYRAFFEKGVIEFNCRNKPTLQVFAGAEPFAPELPNPIAELTSGMNISTAGPYFNEEEYFFDCLKSGTKPCVVTPEAAMETIRVVRAEVASAKLRKQIDLDGWNPCE